MGFTQSSAPVDFTTGASTQVNYSFIHGLQIGDITENSAVLIMTCNSTGMGHFVAPPVSGGEPKPLTGWQVAIRPNGHTTSLAWSATIPIAGGTTAPQTAQFTGLNPIAQYECFARGVFD